MDIKMEYPILKLYNYPLKSSRGTQLNGAEVLPTGIRYDRTVAMVDANNRIVSGREVPGLLTLRSKRVASDLILETNDSKELYFPLPLSGSSVSIRLFRNEVQGIEFDRAANDWVSEYLGGAYRLFHLGANANSVLEKRGGLQGELKGYADSSPIHLINTETLDYLNSKLGKKVTDRNFRPNLVIKGKAPFEEDSWEKIEINTLTYRVQEKTQRCIFTTIDPLSTQRDSAMQPLTTLAALRLKNGLKPTFGINLVPQGEGFVSVGDTVLIKDQNK